MACPVHKYGLVVVAFLSLLALTQPAAAQYTATSCTAVFAAPPAWCFDTTAKNVFVATALNTWTSLFFGSTGVSNYTGPVSITGNSGNGSDKISGVSDNGVFNVVAYGAKGDCVNDDEPAVLLAYNAACAAKGGPNNAYTPTVYFPHPSCEYLFKEPLLLTCGQTINLVGDADGSALLNGGNDIPTIVTVPSTYAASTIGTISATSLATGPGAAMNFSSSNKWYLNLSDAMANATGHAYPLNGLSQVDVRLFFNAGSIPNPETPFFWMGGDPTITAQDCSSSAAGGSEASLCLNNNGALCYQLTTGGTSHRGCGANGAVTTGTTHEAEMAYNGSNVYVFLDGTQISGSPFAQTGTVTQTPWTNILAGTTVQNYPDGGNSSNNYVGQMDSYQISNVARHTANYTADTTKFSNDANTLLLINGTTFNSPLIAADKSEGVTDGWLIARGYGGSQGAATNFRNLSIGGGTIGIFQALTPSPKYDNVTFVSGNIGLELWNNVYEGHFNNLKFSMGNTTEAAITASFAANAETFIATQIINSGYHSIEGADLSGEFLNPFISTDQNSVDDFYDNCDNDNCGVSLIDQVDDLENGGSPVPLYLVGSGNYAVYSGGFSAGAGMPCVQVQPASGGNRLNLSIYGATCKTTAPQPAALVNVVGVNSLKAPINWYGATANGLAYSAQTTVPWTNVPADLIVYGDVDQLPAKTFSTLPSSPTNGMLTYCSDCTIANPCNSGGTGAVAKRLNSVWVCN